jgi:two-component system alkaline phosphatase synthesis response regulator PhoP
MEATKGKILIVDDEQDIVEFIKYNLNKQGFETMSAYDGIEAIRNAKLFKPDLILLDMMMPLKDGMQTILELRSNPDFDNTVIIFLTAISDEASEIKGLEAGADDYITKPIKTELLLTRVKAALRRANTDKINNRSDDDEDVIAFGDLEINRTKFTVYNKEEEIVLAKKEFELLSLLASKPGRVFLRNEILNTVWGTDVIVGDRTIDVHIRKVRQKLNMDVITTVKGVGYKFEIPE